MKRLLLPLLAALALPTAVNANIDPKVAEMCMKASDFQGCVNAMSGGLKTNIESESCKKLNQGLSIVRERLISGTSMMKLDVNTNPLSDALAIAKVETSGISNDCKKRIKGSQEVLDMVRIFREAWNVFNETKESSDIHNGDIWLARRVIPTINAFNLVSGGVNVPVTGPGKSLKWKDTSLYGFDYEIRNYTGGGLFKTCIGECGDYVVKSPISRMITAINEKIVSVINGETIIWPKGPDQDIQTKVLEMEEALKKEKETKKKNSPSSAKINCNSPVWKNKPQCN